MKMLGHGGNDRGLYRVEGSANLDDIDVVLCGTNDSSPPCGNDKPNIVDEMDQDPELRDALLAGSDDAGQNGERPASQAGIAQIDEEFSAEILQDIANLNETSDSDNDTDESDDATPAYQDVVILPGDVLVTQTSTKVSIPYLPPPAPYSIDSEDEEEFNWNERVTSPRHPAFLGTQHLLLGPAVLETETKMLIAKLFIRRHRVGRILGYRNRILRYLNDVVGDDQCYISVPRWDNRAFCITDGDQRIWTPVLIYPPRAPNHPDRYLPVILIIDAMRRLVGHDKYIRYGRYWEVWPFPGADAHIQPFPIPELLGTPEFGRSRLGKFMRDEGLPRRDVRKTPNEENMKLLRDTTLVREETEEARGELKEEQKILQELKEARRKAVSGRRLLEAMEEREVLGSGGRNRESCGKENRGKGKEMQSHTKDAPEVIPHGQPKHESDSEASLYSWLYSSASKTPQQEKATPSKSWKGKPTQLEAHGDPILESEDLNKRNSNFEPSSSKPRSSHVSTFSETPPPTRRSARNKRQMEELPETHHLTTCSPAKKVKLESEQPVIEAMKRSRKRKMAGGCVEEDEVKGKMEVNEEEGEDEERDCSVMAYLKSK